MNGSEIMSGYFNGVEYLKPNKSWCVRVFKLDHDQMVGSRICMSKVIYLSSMLLLAFHFVPT